MIIGVTGPLCAGTDSFCEILKKEKGFLFLSYSDVLREVARQRGIEITRKNLQDLGNELRAERGAGILSEILIEKMESGKNYVVGNIRNPGEVSVLRKKFPENFFLVLINTDAKIRFERLLKRRREKDPQTWEEFLRVEQRDFGVNEAESGQQHAAVFKMADFRIENNRSFDELRREIINLLDDINVLI